MMANPEVMVLGLYDPKVGTGIMSVDAMSSRPREVPLQEESDCGR